MKLADRESAWQWLVGVAVVPVSSFRRSPRMPLLPETPPVPPRSRSAGATLATWAVALAICAFYLWTASSNTVYFQLKGEQDDYYNRLSHGFLEGHLYMKVAPLTQKAREADDLGLGLMPFLLDASFY